MLTAIKGTYKHGQIILSETPAIQEDTEVIVTFLEEETELTKKLRKKSSLANTGIRFGSLAGKIGLPDDFNDPLDDLNEYM